MDAARHRCGGFALSMPRLGLIALMIVAIVAVVALATLAWAVVFVPYMLSRAISLRWHVRSGASPRMAPALSPGGAKMTPSGKEHCRTRQR